MPSGRPMLCVATRNANEGESAPRETMSGASQARPIMTRRRPTLSAYEAIGIAMITPQRTIAAAKPWPCSEIPNSVDAYATVCVKTVFT